MFTLDFFRLIIAHGLVLMEEINTYCALGQVCRLARRAQTPEWTKFFKGLMALQRKMVKKDPEALKAMPNVAIGVQRKLIRRLIRKIPEIYSVQIIYLDHPHPRTIQLNPLFLRYVPQTEALQLIAVDSLNSSECPCFHIRFTNPTDAVKLALVKKCPRLLAEFEEQTAAMQIAGICHAGTRHSPKAVMEKVEKMCRGTIPLEAQVAFMEWATPKMLRMRGETHLSYLARVLDAHPTAIRLLRNAHPQLQQIACKAAVPITQVDHPCKFYQRHFARTSTSFAQSFECIMDPIAQSIILVRMPLLLYKDMPSYFASHDVNIHPYALARFVERHHAERLQDIRPVFHDRIKYFEGLRLSGQLTRWIRTAAEEFL